MLIIVAEIMRKKRDKSENYKNSGRFLQKKRDLQMNKKQNYPQKVGKMCVICELCKLQRVCDKRRRKVFQKSTLFTHKG